MTDRVIINAVTEAQKVLAAYVEPGPRDAAATVDRLIAILDSQELVRAIREQPR